jgi:hypothetical protein
MGRDTTKGRPQNPSASREQTLSGIAYCFAAGRSSTAEAFTDADSCRWLPWQPTGQRQPPP